MTNEVLSDEEIIKILKKAIGDEKLEPWFKSIADDCIARLTTKEDGLDSSAKEKLKMQKENARQAARPIIAKYVKLPKKNVIDYQEQDNIKIKERVLKYIEEIKFYLDTKDLNPDLAACLAFTLEDLTKEGATYKELGNACLAYEVRYKRAAEESTDILPKNSNHQKG